MGLLSKLWGWVSMLLSSKAKKYFDVQAVTSEEMDRFIERCAAIYRGEPEWVDEENHIWTINFAKSICSEMARLTTLAIGVNLSGGPRADWLQAQVEKNYFNLRRWVEYGCAYGTLILKPNGNDIDVVFPGQFLITDCANGEITGAVFQTQTYDRKRKKWFTRLEHHHFLDSGNYAVSNRCFIGETKNDPGKAVDIKETPWSGLAEDVEIAGIERPLFGVFCTPAANNVELDSPLGMPVFAEALEELKGLDVAYSRNAKEIWDSKRTVLLDSDRLVSSGVSSKVDSTFSALGNCKKVAEMMGLPDFVKAVEGHGKEDIYHEINPELNTDTRLTGINALLSQIGYKCGFSNGYFVFNEHTGMVTATQVEADDRRTIQLVKDMRDKLENCLDGLLYALDKFADLYGYAPLGTYEAVYDFGDITYNREEDRMRWQSYVTQGMVPPWYFLMKFEGLTKQEAKALVAEAQGGEEPPYGDEE